MLRWMLGIVVLAGLSHGPARADRVPETMFGGQLVRPTTLAGAVAVEVGGGGALYATDRFYWGGGGGTVFQLGDADDGKELDLMHGELLVGYDLMQSRTLLVSAMALTGLARSKDHSGVFGIGEGRLAVRRPLSSWFMIGGHLAYRRVFGSDLPELSNADLSGPVVGLELYFIK